MSHSTTMFFNDKLIAARVLERSITVSPPIYGSKKLYVDHLIDHNYKELIKSNNIVLDAISWMTLYMARACEHRPESCSDAREYKRRLKVALAKKVPIQRFHTLLAILRLFTEFCFERDEAVNPAPIEDTVHSIVVPIVAPEPCAICTDSYVTQHKCDKCLATLRAIMRVPGYHNGKFANDLQALRYLRGKPESEWRALIAEKRDHRPKVERPIVPKQPPRDFSLSQLHALVNIQLSRADKRMQEHIEKLQAHLPDDAIKPHDVDLAEVWSGIKNFLQSLWESGALPLAAIFALAGAATIAICTWIWRSESPYITVMLRLFATLISAVTIFGGLSIGLAKVVGSFIDEYDRHVAEKHEREKELERIEHEKGKFDDELARRFARRAIDPNKAVAPPRKKVKEECLDDISPETHPERFIPNILYDDIVETEEEKNKKMYHDYVEDLAARGRPLYARCEVDMYKTKPFECAKYVHSLPSIPVDVDNPRAKLTDLLRMQGIVPVVFESPVNADGRIMYQCRIIFGEHSFISGHQLNKKAASAEAFYHAYLHEVGRTKVLPHVGEDPIAHVAEQLMTVTAKHISTREKGFVRSTMEYIHTTATLIRDMKAVADTLQPAVECIVGVVYEHTTGKPWIPWSERSFAELYAPVLEEYKTFNQDIHRITKIHADKEYRKSILAFQKRVEDLEAKLMKMRTPPRYLTAIVAVRNDVSVWAELCNSADMTAHDRPEPVCILLFGEPGTGKTTAMEQFNIDLAPLYHKINPSYSPTWNANMRFMYEVSNEFFDGCKDPAVIAIDDVFQSKDETLRTKEALLFIKLVNRAAFPLHAADISLKDKLFAKPITVQATRNGKKKLTNIGLTDVNAFDRRVHLNLEMLPVGSPSDKNTWRFNRYGPGGVLLESDMTYQRVLKLYKALILAHQKAAQRVMTPTEDDAEETDEQLLALGEADAVAFAQYVRAAASTVLPQTMSKKPPAVRKHGSTFGKENEIIPDNIIIELDDFASTCDIRSLTPSEAKDAMTRLEEIVEALDMEYKIRKEPHPDTHTVADTVTALKERVTSMALRSYTTVKEWTVELWDRLCSWLRRKADAVSASLSVGVVLGAMRGATRGVLEWISQSTFAKIVCAFGAVAILATLVAGVVYAVKSNTLEPHSRTDIEAKREAKRSKEVEDKYENVKIKEGRPRRKNKNKGGDERDFFDEYNKDGKRLPARMRAKPHLRETDMPLIQSFSQNLYTVLMTDNVSASFGQVMMLEGTIGVTALHVARKMQRIQQSGFNTILLTQAYASGDRMHYNRMNVPIPEVHVAPDTEIAFLVFSKALRPHTDITHHLMTDDDLTRVLEFGVDDIAMVYRDTTGQRQIVEASYGRIEIFDEGLFEEDQEAAYLVYDARTVQSSSGGLTMTNSTVYPRKILGIHAGGSKVTAYDAIITYEMYKGMNLKSGGSIVLAPQLDIEPHVMTCTPRDQIVPLGVLKHGHSSGGKNTIAPSPISSYLRSDPEYPIKPTTLPTVCYPRTVGAVADQWIRAGMLSPDATEGLDLSRELHPRERSYTVAPAFVHIDYYMLHYVYDPRDLPAIPGGVYHILSPEQAVFGVRELGIPPIDFTTSCGYNWNPVAMPVFTRYALFKTDKDHTFTPFEQWHPELQRAIKELLTVIANRNYPVGPVVDSLKAERRNYKRVLNGETRMFYAGSIVYLIVSRMITAHLTSLEKKTCTTGTSAVGIAPSSHEWKELHHRLSKHSHHIMTDQRNFDMHNQYVIALVIGERHGEALSACTLYAHRISALWREVAGRDFTTEDFRHWYKAICVSTCVAAHVDGSRVYLDSQTTNSGVDRTSQLNSYRNKLAIRAVFHACSLPYRDDSVISVQDYFNKHVECALYGDDQDIAFDQIDLPWFTPHAYAQMTKELLGGEITTPSKEPITEDTPCVHWQDVEFLKRRFVKEDGNVYAPLEKKVIEESLHWVSKPAFAHKTTQQTVQSALLEAAFHGKEYFDLLSRVCERACRQAGITFARLDYERVRAMVEA